MTRTARGPDLDRTVVRAALLSRLDADSGRSLVVVVAPAGYGKSTLVHQWVARVARAGYLRLTRSHRDPAVLVEDLASTLAGIVPLRQERARPISGRALEPGLQAAARLANAIPELDGPATVVLDDIHVLDDRRAADTMAVFARLAPPSLRIVAAGRDASALDIARLRAEGGVIEIGIHELAFDEEVTLALARRLGVELTADGAAALLTETEGWPVAVSLALRSRADPGAGKTTRSPVAPGGPLADYIRSELLDPLAPEQRSWLLRSSVLEVMTGPSCDAALDVTGSLAMLRRFETSCPLVEPVDETATTYRYHPLLRSLLRDQLEVEMPTEAAAIAAQAATWSDRAGRYLEAFEYAEAAGDDALMAGLMARWVWPLHWTGKITTLERAIGWFDRDGLRDRYASVAVLAGFVYAIDGRRHSAELWLAAAESSTDPGPMPEGSPTEAWVAMLRGMTAARGVEAVEEDARVAESLMRGDSPFMPGVRLLSAVGSLLAGRLDEAARRAHEAAELAEARGAMPGFGMAVGTESMLALRAGDRNLARRLVDAGLERLREAGLAEYVLACLVHAVAARLAVADGSRGDAHQHLTLIHRLRPLMTASVPWLSLPVRLEAIEALIALQDVAAARALMREVDDILRVRPGMGTYVDDAQALRARLGKLAEATVGGWTLTTAELRVLQYLPTHLTFGEIAERLYVSPHTVKSQAVAIYSKLGVSSRRTAIEAAVEYGLLDGSALRFPLGPGIEAGIG